MRNEISRVRKEIETNRANYEFARNELGKDFGRALTWYKALYRNKKYVSYEDLYKKWVLMRSLSKMEGVEFSERMEDRDILDKTYRACINISSGILKKDISDEEKREVILSTVDRFTYETSTETLHKASKALLKATMDDIEHNGAEFVLDSSRASSFVGNKVEISKLSKKMRWVSTSESGISRILDELGLSQIIVFMGQKGKNEQEDANLCQKKEKIFLNGFRDIATGKHYMSSCPSASATRVADFPFIEADTKEEVYDLWLRITGFKSMEVLLSELGSKDENGNFIVNMAKLKARIAMIGSNSFNVFKLAEKLNNPVIENIIKNPKIDYVPDIHETVNVLYKTIKAPGVMELVKDHERETTPCDGMMIGSFTFCAAVSTCLRIISMNDFLYFIENIGKWNNRIDIEDTTLRRIIEKIPSVIQIRHEGCKGIIVKAPIEIYGLDFDLIVPESARKFVATDWANSPLDVCNHLKVKSAWASLNPQFIQGLKFENPNALTPIVDYWFDYIHRSIKDISSAMEFHGITSTVESNDVASSLVAALTANADLIDDFQIVNWRKRQYDKFINDMKIGKLLIPGEYTYMVCDVYHFLNKIYNLDLPELEAGEYWFNDHNSIAAGFRSPLISRFEVQKFNCIERDDFWFWKDIVIFNAYDGAWENMGGGDFDGDTCLICPDSTELGKIICDAVPETNYVVWEKAQSAKKEVFSWENLAKFNAKVAKPDRTGVITNYASRAQDIANHLMSAVYFAKMLNCESIFMVHPKSENADQEPHTEIIDYRKMFVIKGFVHATRDKETREVVYDSNGLFGEFSFEEVEKIANKYLYIVEYLRLLQGREIDSAKTGVPAEGISGQDFVDFVKVEFTPHEMITRLDVLKRPVADFARINSYHSLSPLARLYDYVERKSKDFYDELNNGSDKVALLFKLLSKEEREKLNIKLNNNGEIVTLIDFIDSLRKRYAGSMSRILTTDVISEGEEKKIAINALKEATIEDLITLSNNIGVDIKVIAVACYISAYAKNGNFHQGLTFGWILFNELLEVFSRGGKKYSLYKVPSHAEKVSVKNEYVYVNDIKFDKVNGAKDCDFVPIQLFNGRPYALLFKKVENAIEIINNITSDVVYNIGMLYGFKYCAGSGSKEEFKRILVEHKYTMKIDFNKESRLCCFVEGKEVATIKTSDTNTSIANLAGNTVKITTSPEYEEYDNAIANIVVRTI